MKVTMGNIRGWPSPWLRVLEWLAMTFNANGLVPRAC